MEDYWEYVKAQGTQTARIWGRLSESDRDAIRQISPVLVANLDSLRAGVDMEVEV